MKNNLKEISLSFWLTFFILGGFGVLLLTHYRIQNTIIGEYILLEMYKNNENHIDIMFDNTLYNIDITQINNFFKNISSLEVFIPAPIKIITNTLNSITEYFYLYLLN